MRIRSIDAVRCAIVLDVTEGSAVPQAMRPLDPGIRVALALHARPGGYVALLGAGVSTSSGVMSVWEVLEALIARVAAAHGESPSDPTAWWKERHGSDPTYPQVLGEVANTSEERRVMLAEYFERSESDRELNRRGPTAAHRDIAELVAEGVIRIILTTNFDLLMEEALREVGLTPLTIASPEAVAAMEPLHVQQCVVIHLHGDYLSTGMLNTDAELAVYAASINGLVKQAVDEYGLLIVGWSARWDTALSNLIGRARPPRYSTWWVEPAPLNAVQRRVIARRAAEVIPLAGDEALARILSTFRAVQQAETAGDPISAAVAVATAKRELVHRAPAIRSHDILRAEIDAGVARPSHLQDNRGRQGASRLGYRLIVAYLLLAAPIASAALFWGSWGWVVAAAAVAVVEFATLQRSQRFSARVWRSLRVGRNSSRERATESLYVITAVAGVALLVMAVLSAV